MSFDKYFDDKEYYMPSVMMIILEDIIGKSYTDIKSDIINSSIVITGREIVDFLEQQFLDFEPATLLRVNNSDLKYLNSDKLFGEGQLDYLKKYSDSFEDYLIIRKYTFEPYSLEYFKKYISVLKNKLLFLLDNYFLISCGCPNLDLLDQLDIVFSPGGLISKYDIVRLIKPIIYNLEDLNRKLMEANDLSTYLSFKMSRFSLYRNGLFDNDIYPSCSLQVDNLLSCEDGYVPLSSNQRKRFTKK